MKPYIFLTVAALCLYACDCDELEPTDPKLPDLVVQFISQPDVDCPGGGGTCVTTVAVEIANIGDGDAGMFNVRATMDPSAMVVVDRTVSSLAAGSVAMVVFMSPAGGNCYDPDCSILVVADSNNDIVEENENNNDRLENFFG
ncbi:MAG: CARDB domain-containing protein [Saprospiraceae bacterium]|nr:CARDB domain-containing protein [Saprospiraceae bacterium]